MEIPDYQKVAMMEYVQDLLGNAKWHGEEISKITKTLMEYSHKLGIEIDFEKFEIRNLQTESKK